MTVTAIKSAALGFLAVSILLVAMLSIGDHSPRLMNGGGRFIAEAAGSLLAYVVFALFVDRAIASRGAYLIATFIGAVAGCVQIVHMSLESFGAHIGDRADLTLLFMGASFLLWLSAAIAVGRRDRKVGQAALAGGWSAMCTMILAITYGLILTAVGYPEPSYVATWPEFTRSGWPDPQTFSIANSFDAVMSHFLIAPIVGIVLGTLGGWIAAACGKSPIASSQDA
ncbi:MAG: hypothetical protein WAM82_29150 [Thermoanaerobaculia bacterium]